VKIRNVYKILVGKPQGNRQLGGPRGMEDNIKMDLGGIGCKSLSWTDCTGLG
jgi:hypothetical protein